MTDSPRTLHIASWDDRFLAWLLDILLVGVVLSALGQAAGVFSLLTGGLSLTTPATGLNGLGLFVYWTVLEGRQGQSAGKIVMNIAVTDERGDAIGYGTAAIESFGKAFLLPIDILVGWLAYEEEGLRLFNKLSSTIVVETDEEETGKPSDVEYVYPNDG
ncbi:RDD family protein [Haloarcula sp. CBA1130]|uniref:RDD family protein n=1 Tax=unclassified Haloarcula TaxID=2624677 RepID=UPI001244B787|nr:MULTISPECIES: RDD family protein [unclassified Haloarcula]KAA9399220.1 RDD family protein [Haloarcula sp. CBA1129]KAA9403733.1 RDD family protein [Haloarcula sp. CBA1130]